MKWGASSFWFMVHNESLKLCGVPGTNAEPAELYEIARVRLFWPVQSVISWGSTLKYLLNDGWVNGLLASAGIHFITIMPWTLRLKINKLGSHEQNNQEGKKKKKPSWNRLYRVLLIYKRNHCFDHIRLPSFFFFFSFLGAVRLICVTSGLCRLLRYSVNM